MSINLNPEITLSPNSISSGGQAVTATVSVRNRPSYAGKPKITGLTTITPKIICSRSTTGTAPFGVYVSAWETSANSGDAYADLDYRWNFGDSSGVETFTDQWNGKAVNANTDQVGPEAAYLYRNAGTYTITLTVTGKDENGNLVTATTSTLHTVGQHYIFLANATGGTYTLTFNGQTTAPIAWSAGRDARLAALHALSNLDSTNCEATFRGCIEFCGEFTGQSYSFAGDFSGLTGTNGTPQIRTESSSETTASITVEAETTFSVRYFDSNYDGSNGASDGTIDRPYTLISDLRSWCLGAERVAYLKRGSEWTMTADWRWTAAMIGVRVLPYGTGAKPIINSMNYRFMIEISWGSSTYSTGRLIGDILFSNIVINHLGPSYGVFDILMSNNDGIAYPYGRCFDLVLDNVDYNSLIVATGTAGLIAMGGTQERGQASTRVMCWNCNLDMNVSSKQGLFIGLDQWFCVIGGSIIGGDGDIVRDHHIYSIVYKHQLYRWINFGLSISKNYCLNLNASNTGHAQQCVLVDGCNLTGTQNCIDFSNSSNSYAGYTGHFDDCIVQFSKLHSGQISSQQNGIFCYNLHKITIRDCMFWDNNQSNINCSDKVQPYTPSIYRNIFWDGVIRFRDNQIPYMYDNIMLTTTASRPCIALWDGVSHTGTLSQWDCDNNLYYSPNATSPFRMDPSTFISISGWQAYGNDASGTFNTNPNFPDGGEGVFISNPTISVSWPDAYTNLEYSLDSGNSWSAYTNSSNQSIGASLSGWTEVLFKSLTNQAATVAISGYSETNNVWTSGENFSAMLTSSLTSLYHILHSNNLNFIFRTEI